MWQQEAAEAQTGGGSDNDMKDPWRTHATCLCVRV